MSWILGHRVSVDFDFFFFESFDPDQLAWFYALHIDFNHTPHTLKNSLPQSIETEHFDLFDLLTRYYLNNRYPDHRMNLSAQIDAVIAADIYARTKEVFAWLQTLKP